jgi:hypothetical protein
MYGSFNMFVRRIDVQHMVHSTEHETTINIYTIPDLYYTFVVGYACAF